MKSTSAYAKMKKKITESNSMSSPVRNIHKLKKNHKTPVFDNHTCKQSKYHTFISYQQFTSI